MKLHSLFRVSVLLILFGWPMTALTDAIMVSQAMFASTIAEYFVEEDHVQVDLEIGVNDLASFRNLLPDAIYQELGYQPEALDQRLKLFFERDLAIQ